VEAGTLPSCQQGAVVASTRDADMSVAEFLRDLQKSSEDVHTKGERLITYATVHWPNRWRTAPPARALPHASEPLSPETDEEKESGTA
jgi:hypothetical protein